MYDPDDPASVRIDSRAMLEIVPRVVVVIGLSGIVLVLFEVFNITSVLEQNRW